MWQSCHRVTLLYDFICSHQPTQRQPRPASHCLPMTKSCSPPALHSTPEQEMQGKQDQGRSHWPQKVAEEKDYQGGVSAHLTFLQNFHCKHQSTEERAAEGAALGCMPDLLQPSQYPKSVQTGRHSHHAFNKTPSSCPRYPGDLGNTSETIFPIAVTTLSSKGQLHKSCVTCHIYLRCY